MSSPCRTLKEGAQAAQDRAMHEDMIHVPDAFPTGIDDATHSSPAHLRELYSPEFVEQLFGKEPRPPRPRFIGSRKRLIGVLWALLATFGVPIRDLVRFYKQFRKGYSPKFLCSVLRRPETLATMPDVGGGFFAGDATLRGAHRHSVL